MRRLFTTDEALAKGLSTAGLRWGERQGRWRRIDRGIYGEGPDDPSHLERALAAVVATGGVASGHLAGVLHRLDSVDLQGPDMTLPPERSGRRAGVRRRRLDTQRIVEVDGFQCTDGLQTLLDLAPDMDDARWEQALESALRKHLVSVADIEASCAGVRGAARIRRVLALRPPAALPAESLLETLMVQLARAVDELPTPVRQHQVVNRHGDFVARVDLAWPELGLFIELDGQHHKDQPVHDARRETAVVAATGWLCGRFTWTEVVRFPRTTARRLEAIVDQARRRPLQSPPPSTNVQKAP